MQASRRIICKLIACVAFLTIVSGCGDGPAAPQNEVPAAQTSTRGSSPNVRRAPDKNKVLKPAGTLPAFRMVGVESGFDFSRNDDIQGHRRIIEANGGGAAMFDFDGDGRLDVFMTNGCRLPLRLDGRDTPSELFHNLGNMQFERVTSASGLMQFRYATGCAVGDYDADGFDDLYIAAFGPGGLWRNNGDGTFDDVTSETGTAVPKWSTSVAFADVDGDGSLDLYVANYLAESDSSPKLCPNPASPDGYEQCPPAMFDGVDDVLFLSNGAGQFVDVTAAAGIAGTAGKGLGVVICDFNGDGRPEIFVANDGEANFLFVQAVETAAASGAAPMAVGGNLNFRDEAPLSGVALDASGHAQANMGIAAGDFDANGTIDLFVTTFFGDKNTLYANRGKLLFEDVTRPSRLGATTRNKLGFGTAFLDVDNDGWLDLFTANGHIDDRTWMPHGEPYRMRPQLFRNERDGSFVEVSEWSGDYFHKEWLGRGVAVGDLDRDGKVDAVVSHQLDRSIAIHNETPTDHQSLVLRFVGTTSNRSGYGVRVEVVDAEPRVFRELTGGGSFQSGSAAELHIGLGIKGHATLKIQWPSGIIDLHRELQPGTWLLIEGGSAPKSL